MPPREKAKLKKLIRKDERAVYTWHLHPPFNKEFDHSHWWKKLPSSEIEPIAALYELVRRLPCVGYQRALPEWSRIESSDQLWWLLNVGDKPWIRLDARERLGWQLLAGNLKGLDCRPALKQCFSIETEALTDIGLKRLLRQRAKYAKMKVPKAFDLLERDMAKHPPSAKQLEAAITRLAIEAQRGGYVLLAVAPDLAANQAESRMLEEYKKTCRPAKKARRVRWQDWLPLVSAFEDAEVGNQKDTSQIFVRYRRMLDGIISK